MRSQGLWVLRTPLWRQSRAKACFGAATTFAGVSERPTQRDAEAAGQLCRKLERRKEAQKNLWRTRRLLATSAAIHDEQGLNQRLEAAARNFAKWVEGNVDRYYAALRVFWRVLEVPAKLLGFGLCVAAATGLQSAAKDSPTDRDGLLRCSRWCWRAAVQIAQSTGPTFVKLLQWCTTRRDLFSVEFCDEIGALQYCCALDGDQMQLEAERQMEKTFGTDWREYVQLHEVLGTGCIATVYRGTLGPNGIRMANEAKNVRAALDEEDANVEVAVKVLRKGARESVFLDLHILDSIVACLESSKGATLDLFPVRESFEDFKKMMLDQLDMRHEATSMRAFRENYLKAHELATQGGGEILGYTVRVPTLLEPLVDVLEQFGLRYGFGLGFGSSFGFDKDAESGDPDRGRNVYIPSRDWKHRNSSSSKFVVPEIYFCPSPDVLVEEYVKGPLLSTFLQGKRRAVFEAEELARAGSVNALVERRDQVAWQLGQIGLHGFLRMMFDDNFIHGDLHPGNMIILQGDGANLDSASANESSEDVKLALLDGGISVQLSEDDLWNIIDLFYHVGTGKTYEAGLLFLRNAAKNECRDPEGFARRFQHIADTLIEDKFQTTSREVGGLVEGLLDLCREYNVRLDPAFSKVIISIVVVEGLGKSLDESLDIIREAVPTMARARRRLRAKRRMRARRQAGYSGVSETEFVGKGMF